MKTALKVVFGMVSGAGILFAAIEALAIAGLGQGFRNEYGEEEGARKYMETLSNGLRSICM